MTTATTTKERPILFSGPMVRAILAGQKTQTRRVMKSQPDDGYCARDLIVEKYFPAIEDANGMLTDGPEIFGCYSFDGEWGCKCPYGGPGDRLWVRETWRIRSAKSQAEFNSDGFEAVEFRADTEPGLEKRNGDAHWRPSIFMPRWACRIILEITQTRVERLHDMPPRDVNLEGFPFGSDLDGFKALWKKLNGADSWDANPWVWVVSFKRCETDS